MSKELKCSVCGCLESETSKFYKNSKYGENLCSRHRWQLKTYGKIRDDKIRITKKEREKEHFCSVCNKSSFKVNKFYYKTKHGDDLCQICYNKKSNKSYNQKTEQHCSICGISSNDANKFIYNSKHGENICGKCYKPLNKRDKKKTYTNECFCSICKKSSFEDDRFVHSSKYGDNLCSKHYRQLSKYGYTFDRTRMDDNEIVIYNNYAEIILYDKNCKEIARTKVDLEDLNRVKNIKWGLDNYGYVKHISQKTKPKVIKLHRLILDVIHQPKIHVDHKNHITTDNRKSNLRLVTPHQNSMNCQLSKNNTSGHAGVSCNKMSTWDAYIHFNYKKINLGRYYNIEDAIFAREQGEIKYFGEYRNKEEGE